MIKINKWLDILNDNYYYIIGQGNRSGFNSNPLVSGEECCKT